MLTKVTFQILLRKNDKRKEELRERAKEKKEAVDLQ